MTLLYWIQGILVMTLVVIVDQRSQVVGLTLVVPGLSGNRDITSQQEVNAKYS